MFVRWKRRKHTRSLDTYYAVLVRCVRVDGEPRQRIVSILGHISGNPSVNPGPYDRSFFWRSARDKLRALRVDGTLDCDTSDRIEAKLHAMVAEPTEAELRAADEERARWQEEAHRRIRAALDAHYARSAHH